MVVMSSHGHGRSAAVLGSVTTSCCGAFGPIVVVGPHASPTAGELHGSYVVPSTAQAQ
jgi:hypothetical protein